MVNILEYAFLSAHVYGVTESKTIQSVAAPANHTMLPTQKWVYMVDVDFNTKPANHFFAQLYLKFQNGKATDAVVAVRGTVFSDKTNLGVDVLSWYADALGEGSHDRAPLVFTNLLINFVVKARNYIRKYFPHISHLKFTGHSLGGAMAQLMPLRAGFLGEAVVFNSPGVGHIPGVKFSNTHWVTLVNSRYGIINKIGQPVNTPLIIDVPNMEAEAKALFDQSDTADYVRSEKIYQMSDALVNTNNKLLNLIRLGTGIGLKEYALLFRLRSLDSSYNSLTQLSRDGTSVQNMCQTTNSHIWSTAKTQLATSLCINKYKLGKLNDIITAQHSIDNMVGALQNKTYTNIAYRNI